MRGMRAVWVEGFVRWGIWEDVGAGCEGGVMSQLWRMTWVSEVCKTTRVLGMYRSHKDQAIPEEVQERYRRTGIVSYSQLLPKQ